MLAFVKSLGIIGGRFASFIWFARGVSCESFDCFGSR